MHCGAQQPGASQPLPLAAGESGKEYAYRYNSLHTQPSISYITIYNIHASSHLLGLHYPACFHVSCMSTFLIHALPGPHQYFIHTPVLILLASCPNTQPFPYTWLVCPNTRTDHINNIL